MIWPVPETGEAQHECLVAQGVPWGSGTSRSSDLSSQCRCCVAVEHKNRQILMRFLCCAGYLFIRAINSANKDQERQDKIDGY